MCPNCIFNFWFGSSSAVGFDFRFKKYSNWSIIYEFAWFRFCYFALVQITILETDNILSSIRMCGSEYGFGILYLDSSLDSYNFGYSFGFYFFCY